MNCNSENNGQVNTAGNQFPAPSDWEGCLTGQCDHDRCAYEKRLSDDLRAEQRPEAAARVTTVVNKHRHTPTPNDVYIGRGSQWGNNFSHLQGTKARWVVGSREEAVEAHRAELWALLKAGDITLESLAALHGKTLVCFCAPKRCHGHTLAKAAAWAVEQLAKPGVRLDAPYGVHAYMDSSTEKEV